jgi:hypothetical protein
LAVDQRDARRRASRSGGTTNRAGGISASVSGGYNNLASGDRSTVSGGENNTASRVVGDATKVYVDTTAVH